MKNRILILLTLIFVFACSSLVCAKVEMGMNGSAVQSVQYMLMDTGYLAGGADGIFGSATEDAVKRFQADYGLDVDGIVGSQTMAALSEASGREAPAEEGVGSYQRRIVMDASAYTADDPGNSGFTATGLRLRRGMVSVDPDVIPLGSQLYIEGYGYATAEDTGGSIVGNRIDLAMDSITEALNFGRREVVVYVL
ncbi:MULTISPECIES: peptidoglycan-binding protein [Megasphaera]|nr:MULTISPECIES: peptidoglycan-binding protein [Megasphaera]MDN0046475.1 peptidoglycan-binding protein [Megasphaera hexanoica]SCJ38665.1 Cell wall-binding protein yocH precursor [uncultured Ruminococcus sp.]MCU6714861.1 peptidoglycan-binding protein [Megasphaera butyrica]SCH79923.1 Cell wall-binding protein yocH precursor [uncultured Megasphaera sp.]HJE81884.1 peptidoglycan-binding protein [Megasphaera stantonii]